MVVVKIEMWPHGDETKAFPIGQMNIANDGTGDVAVGQYEVELLHAGSYFGKPGAWKSAKGFKYLRRLSPYHLVAAALKACGITNGGL